ncbi:MAG TPA: hypothetical protein VHJ40_08565 [Actinomycetota bacterium]|jgi:hypothetical protein|nr:hypothetical protein [Actinomycetota bacterium]
MSLLHIAVQANMQTVSWPVLLLLRKDQHLTREDLGGGHAVQPLDLMNVTPRILPFGVVFCQRPQ